MTWSAAAADRLVRNCSPLPRRQLVPEPRVDGFPQIVELIPRKRLIALAQDSQAVPPLPALRRRSVAAAAIGVLTLGAATAMLQAWTKAWNGISPLVPIGGAMLAVLVLAGQEVSKRLSRSEREMSEQKLIETLEKTRRERPQAWGTLVEALSEELEKIKTDRAVIIDDFDRLDEITRDTLRHYITHRSHQPYVHELWIIFEDADLAQLSKAIQLSRPHSGSRRFIRMKTLRQTSLNEQARKKLASEIGDPERADFHLVKSIIGREADVSETYRKLFDGQYAAQRHDVRAYGPLEFAYLLAVQHRTGAWGFRESTLVSDISSSTVHQEVLQLLLPGARFNRGEVGDAVDGIKNELTRALDPDRLAAGEIEVFTEAAEVLIERRTEYDLPAEDVAHLYWALYWYSQLRGSASVDAYRLRKLARHLVLAASPGALETGIGQAVHDRFQEALIWTAQALISASLPDTVPALLIRAEREMPPDENPSRLRSVCWQAYAVLGDEDLLAIILRLHPGTAGTPVGASEPESFFVESLRFTDPTPSARRELSERLLTLDREVLSYTQVRGLWLALTLEPVSRGTSLRFRNLSNSAATRAASLVREALRMLDDPNQPRVMIATLTASLGTWCYALGFLRGGRTLAEADDVLEDVYRHTSLLHDVLNERRRSGEGEDYVLRAFAYELEAIVSAAALVIGNASRTRLPVEPTEEDLARLRGLQKLGGRVSSHYESVMRRLSLQALTWRTLGSSGRKPLGFDQLAAFVTLRWVHLKMLVPGDGRTVSTTMSELAGQLHEPGVVGLMAYAITMRSAGNQEMRAYLWARAARLALTSGLGEGLQTELCLAVLIHGHSYKSVDKQEFAEYLVGDGWSFAGSSKLGRYLAELDDDTRHDAALWLLNTAKDEMPSMLADNLVAETEAMRDSTRDDHARDGIQQAIDLFKMARIEEEGGTVPVFETLSRWESRRDSYHYAWMLHLLIGQADVGGDALEAAATYLTLHPDKPPSSGPVILARDLARLADGHGTSTSDEYCEIALSYLDRVHPSMEHLMPIETNIDILALLMQHSVGDMSSHFENLGRWETVRQERYGLERLPDLVGAGRFFLVFWHYLDTLAFYGLATDSGIDFEELLSSDGEARALAEWRARDEPVPEAMVEASIGAVLSTDFLRYGRALFGKVEENPDLEEARSAFNEAALEALPTLFNQLRSLSDLPKPIRTLLTEHQEQLFRDRARIEPTDQLRAANQYPRDNGSV